MNTIYSISVPRSPLQMICAFAFSILLFSCSGEDLITEADLSAAALETNAVAASKKTTPVDDIIAAIAIKGGFEELVKALTFVDEKLHTQLVDLFLYGTDQYTVYVPTDVAFATCMLPLESKV